VTSPEQCIGSSITAADQPTQHPQSAFTALSSDLTDILATSRDYNELLFAWKGWRDASGAKIKDKYKRYVELSNKAAVLNGQCPAPSDTHHDLGTL